jgi:DNA-binding MarR family transcriptional regulator
MPGRLLSEIKQTRPFALPELEAYLNLVRSADALARESAAVLKPHGLSGAQYNILRILRGAGAAGLPCGEIGARLITHDPDVTRLIDKLERRGLVARARDAADRRVVTVRITAAGQAIAGDPELERALNDLHRRQFAALAPDEVPRLIDLLERCRQR